MTRCNKPIWSRRSLQRPVRTTCCSRPTCSSTSARSIAFSPRLARALRPGGEFCFSLEAADGQYDWDLRLSLGYAHSEGYIRMLAGQHGFAVRRLSRHPLRIDQGQPVGGLFAWLDRTGHTV